jgi:serine/threonine-protein kinase
MSDTREALQRALGDAFTITRELGGGGMSRVFLAREVALGREVVVKVVPIEGGAAAVERFKREIQTAAQLQHPHIVPVLTAGVADGVPWFTMPFVPGDSLRARLAGGGALRPADAVKVLRDVAQALAFAHERGFIHRDIKPDNVLLADGVAVVTDFGVAKALSSATSAAPSASATATGMTAIGMALGTPAYMAPEQASADPSVDHRADLYAWGCLAYELLTGATPFGTRTHSQLFAAHLTEPPPPLAPRAADCPPALAALVMRCLEKDPARRPQSARELLAALDAMVTPPGARGAAPVPRRAAPAWARNAMVMGGVALIALAGWWIRSRPASSAAAPASADSAPADPLRAGTALAVLPFVNTGGDPQDEYFSDGMTDELTHALSRLPGLRLAGRSTAFSYKGRSVPAQEIGQAIGVKAIVEGTVRRSGPRVRVTAQLTSTGDGRVLWSDSFERTDRDVFAVQDAVTGAIVGALSPLLGGATPGAVSAAADTRGTTDAVAYDLYLRGRFFWAQRGITPMDSALAYFRQAVQRDPRFARGWAGLALTHVVRPNYNARVPARASFDSAESAARRALALDSTLADAYSALAMAQAKHLDVRGAMATFDRAIRLEPQNANAHHWAGLVSGWAGDIPRAARELEQALALDPLSAALLNTAAMVAAERRRPDEAGPRWERAYALSDYFRLSTWFSGANISRVALGQGDSVHRAQLRVLAAPAQRRQVELSRLFYSTRMLAAAAVENWRQARALRDTIMGGKQPGILAFDRALVATVFGTRAEAAALFIESLRDDGPIANLAMTPCLAALEFVRTEPNYRAFLAQQGLAECPLPPQPWPVKRAPEAPAP